MFKSILRSLGITPRTDLKETIDSLQKTQRAHEKAISNLNQQQRLKDEDITRLQRQKAELELHAEHLDARVQYYEKLVEKHATISNENWDAIQIIQNVIDRYANHEEVYDRKTLQALKTLQREIKGITQESPNPEQIVINVEEIEGAQ